MKNKILLVLPGIWSMGKNKGMPSVHNFIDALQKDFNVLLITPDRNVESKDYTSVNVLYTRKLPCYGSNRYLKFFIDRVNYLIACIYVIFHGVKNRSDYNLIYANYAVPAAKFLSILNSVPLVIRIYGTFLYSSLNNLYTRLVRYEEVFLFKISADLYVITNDGTQGNKVADYYGIERSKVRFLMNGVNPARKFNDVSRSEFGIPESSIVLLTTSRLANWKRVDRIVKAVRTAACENLFLVIAGDGPEVDALKRIAENDLRILFLGAVDSEMVERLYEISDWYMSTHDVSNVGNPLLQSLKRGIPVLTCATGNTMDMVNEDLQNGICLEFHSEDDLMQKLTQTLYKIGTGKIDYERYKRGALLSGKSLKSWEERINYEISEIKGLI